MNNTTTMFEPPQMFNLYLKPLSLIFTIGGILGSIGNSLIIYAIFYNKTLHNVCHYLMQQLAIADLISCLSFLEMGLLAVSLDEGTPPYFMMTNIDCVKCLIPLITSLVAGNLLVLIIGIDRFIAVYFVRIYDSIPIKLVAIYSGISWLSGGIFTLTAFLSSSNDPVPACFPPTAFQGFSLDLWNTSGICLNAAIIAVYLAVIIKAHKKFVSKVEPTDANGAKSQRRKWKVIKTLVVVVVVFVLTWTATTIIIKILIETKVSGPTLFHGVAYVGILCLANISLNFIIYYTRLSEFQDTIRRLFGRKSAPKVGSTQGVSTVPTILVASKM